MAIDRCVCFNRTFAELKTFCDAHQSGLDDLRRQFGCGRGCALCVPYLQAMLETGTTVFMHEIPFSRHATDGGSMMSGNVID